VPNSWCRISIGIHRKATLDDPDEYFEEMLFLKANLLEVWFFDPATGQVYAKAKPPAA
jgi:hypothetical protein